MVNGCQTALEKETDGRDLVSGEILEGTVSGIAKFGAFVRLPGGVSGLVHISEISDSYVNDVNDFLRVGDTVSVKVLSVTSDGKINLSVKQASSRPAAKPPRTEPSSPAAPRKAERESYARASEGEVLGPSGDASFEEKLKQFMKESESKVSGNKLYENHRSNGRRRK